MVDLPNAFGCISGKLLIAQHRAYVFDTKLAVYYLHDRIQKVKIDDTLYRNVTKKFLELTRLAWRLTRTYFSLWEGYW